MSHESINASQCLSTVIFAQQVIACALDDLKVDLKHRTPIYNLDFSVLVGTLFNRGEPGVQPFLPGSRAAMSHILSHLDHTEPYVLAISGTVYYEFLDQLAHILDSLERVRELKTLRSQIPDVTEQTFEHLLDERHFLQTTSELTARLSTLTQEGRDRHIAEPARKLLEYLKTNKIHGIGDYLGPPRASVNLPAEFHKIFRTQVDLRLKRDASRPEEESLFHYKMDAVSICLSLYYARELNSKMLFVTRSFANLASCKTNQNSVGRHYYVPLALKNLSLFFQDGYVRDPAEFLQDALEAATNLRRKITEEILNRKAEFLRGHLVTQYYSFYNTFYCQLMQTKHIFASETEVSRERLREIMAHSTKLADAVDAAVSEIETVAKIVSEQVENLGLEYLSDFGLEDDPVLNRIKKRFNIE